MRCPFCGSDDTQVKDSRSQEDGTSIKRRRFCPSCQQKFTTIERIYLRDFAVIKSDSRSVSFDRDKLARSIKIAVRKRPIQESEVDRLVNDIVRELENYGENEIRSSYIGELVMKKLLTVDPVAYIRFASVYKDFRGAKDFSEIVQSITNPIEVEGKQNDPLPTHKE
ncbi:transcriptional regulator NrdR [Entomobacter blattae]|uniref:Transcriptional repressor NrdR n=1 Tax=Entomobacter blattae TaxID=2762277 RepID=A0A7H1NSY9_9PROT|nr:transcriptional regulator NrdR [Entomobacter blattae]QNT78899.1 Transcriptional repressor NrdR [Entomobacter blattae]